jgi:hypothetical protein
MIRLNLPKPLIKPQKLPELPIHKTSLDQLSKTEMRNWYRKVCQQLYPDYWIDMMQEYGEAVADEPEGRDGHQIQLYALLAYYVWWY